MEKISCEVIGDLLPLYCDDVCSEDSRKIVEEHLRDCPECSDLLQKIKTEYRLSGAEGQPQEDMDMVKNMASRWQQSLKKSFCRGVLVTVCACLILAGSYWALTRLSLMPVPLAVTQAEVQDVSGDHVTIRLRVTDGNKVLSTSTEITEDGKCYVRLLRGILPTDNGGGQVWESEWSLPRTGIAPSGREVSVREIYCGTESGCILIWQAE